MLLLLHSEEKKYITDEADFREDHFRSKLDVCSLATYKKEKRRKGENYDFYFFFNQKSSHTSREKLTKEKKKKKS